MPSFYVENFGCRAAQADGAAIEQQFAERGLHRAPHASAAEIVVLNTCTVTAAADQDARAAIRRLHRANPDSQIVVTGCYAQRAPQEVASLPGVTRVIGNSHKHRLGEIILAHSAPARTGTPTLHTAFVPLKDLTISGQGPTTNDRGPIFVSDIFAHTELLAAPVFDAAKERTRPNLKVQDGCDNRCSFCIIPSVRGHSRSLPLAEVLREINAMVVAGYREIVISGINLGRWGRDLWKTIENRQLRTENRRSTLPSLERTINGQRLCFEDLLRAVLAQTSLEKLRISSVEPMDWSDELIRLMAESPRIAKHAHVPLQSASDAALRRMHRKYRPWHYREKIEKIRSAMPAAAIGADVMAGFPGETDAEFEQTRRMIETLPFTYLHVFTYSARPGTPAAAMPGQVPVHAARERNRILRELAAQKKLAFMRSFIGKTVEAITLNSSSPVLPSEVGVLACEPVPEVEGPRVSRDDAIITEALTDNYLKLRLEGRHPPNRWITAQVERVESEALLGRLAG